MRESDILHENGSYWVRKELYGYVVYRNGITHAESIEAYNLDDDGLSIAKASCDYKASQAKHYNINHHRKGE